MRIWRRRLWATWLAALAAMLCLSRLEGASAPAADKASSPANIDPFEQNKRLGRGVNVLGYDPIWRSESKARFQARHFAAIHEAGFNHVRINLFPFRDARPRGADVIAQSYWHTLDWAVEQALAARLMVILDFHEFNEMARDPAAKKDRFLATWKQIAEHCQNAPGEVLFEILNEPHGQLTAELWNEYLGDALKVIRETNPNRTVIIGPAGWNGIDQLTKLELPERDRNIIVTIHYYSPMAFTHQGAGWTEQKYKVGVPWNGTEKERANIERDFDKAQAWADSHHRPIYLGEFGAIENGETASRARYLDFVARQAEKRGWSWAYWQFDGDFIVYDIPNQRWVEPIRDALLGKK